MIPVQFTKRNAARVFAVLAVAFAAGHLVQTIASPGDAPMLAEAAMPKPVAVVPLAADPVPAAPPVIAAAALPASALTPPPVPAVPEPVIVADPCPLSFDVMAQPGALLGLTLIAPCHPGARVVLRHAGLAITATTTATGSLFIDLPGLDRAGEVDVMLPDGTTLTAVAALTDLGQVRRFGVQWQANDAFQLHAFETDAAVETHVFADNRQSAPIGGVVARGGYLMQLGDPSTELPLLAEIYTFPAASTIAADVVVEAAITPATCNRELLAETLTSMGGAATVTDLSLAMPECDAVGDFLVLNNLAPDPKIAAAD